MMTSDGNERDTDVELLGENSPPLAPDTPTSNNRHLVYADAGSPTQSRIQSNAPLPASAAGNNDTLTGPTSDINDDDYGDVVTPPVYDEGTVAQIGGAADSGIYTKYGHNETKPARMAVDNGDKGPPPNRTSAAGSSPYVNTAVARRKVTWGNDEVVRSGSQDPDRSSLTEGGEDTESGRNDNPNQTQPALMPLDNRGVEAIDDNEAPPLPPSMTETSALDALKSPMRQHTRNGNAIRSGEGIKIIDDNDSSPQPLIMPGDSFNSFLQYVYNQPSTILAYSLDELETTSKRVDVATNVARSPGTRTELIEDIDGDGPPQPITMLADSFDKVDIISKKATCCLESSPADDEFSPRPFDPTEFEDVDDMEKKKQHVPQQPVHSDEGTPVIPIEVQLDAADGRVEAELSPTIIGANTYTTASDARRTEDGEEDAEQINDPESTTMNATVDLETGSPYQVPEAELISDEVYNATPLDPPLEWWKQKQSKCFFVCMFVVLIAAAIFIGVILSSNDPVPTNIVTVVVAGLMSSAPSISLSPSASVIPTNSPSAACVATIYSNEEKINLQVNDPYDPRVAVDGRNMVVAAADGGVGRPVHVMFHSLATDVWQMVDIFYHIGSGSPSIAISGETALVGFPNDNAYAGAVFVYKQNQFGDWEEVGDPFIHNINTTHSRFGQRVGIHGDLAFVADYGHVYIFRLESSKWKEIDRIEVDAADISISGDVIAIHYLNSTLGGYVIHLYKCMPDLDGVVSIQDPISVRDIQSMDLSNNYLVYWDRYERDAFIYRQEESNQTFVFHQQLKISGPSDNYGLVLDNDILVVSGDSGTHIFSEQNGSWLETITLNQRYDKYALSGRQLLASTHNHKVYSYNIQDCAQEMPTQTPSVSSKPSASATTLSMSPSISPAPSSSLSPTGMCKNVTIAVVYDVYPVETSWELWKVVDDGGDDELFKSHQGLEGDVSHSQPICLQKGEWKFDISDSDGDGLCCSYGEGHYNVTSNGALITEGGDFRYSESTTFSIPFVPAP